MTSRELFKLTDAAADRVKHLIDEQEKSAAVLRISVRTQGCSGLAYSMEYADAPAHWWKTLRPWMNWWKTKA